MTVTSACAMMRAVTRRPTLAWIIFVLLSGVLVAAPAARSAETYKGSKLPSPWRPASSRPSAWTKRASKLKVPVYITVGARDMQTPPAENAEFAAKYISGAELAVIPGDVDHEIFVNECDDEGRDEFPEACIDASGVDRHAIHQSVVRPH